MDNHAHSILTQFETLSIESRQAVLSGILNQLSRSEWRKAKEQADQVTFDCDIFGKLPFDLICHVVKYLDLADLFVLQRVSRQWQDILSLPKIQLAAVRAIMPSNFPELDPEVNPSLKELVQKRLRLERGQPDARYYLSCPLFTRNDRDPNIFTAGYSNGIFAYVSPHDSGTSIVVSHFKSGNLDHLTTEDRDPLWQIRVSNLLIAAVSVRGYCHVWDIRSQEHRSFRLPSINGNHVHFLVNGLKVVFAYRTSIIHWGWDSGIARTIPLKAPAVMVAPHPTEDQLTIVRTGEDVYHGGFVVIFDNTSHLSVEHYAVDDTNEFVCKHSQYQPFPLGSGEQLRSSDGQEIFHAVDASEIYDGQSSILMTTEQGSSCLAGLKLWFCLENDKVVAHSLTSLSPVSKVKSVGQDVIYALLDSKETLILDSTYTTAPASSTAIEVRRHTMKRQIDNTAGPWVFGDSDYVVFIDRQYIEVWCFLKPWYHPAKGYLSADLDNLITQSQRQAG